MDLNIGRCAGRGAPGDDTSDDECQARRQTWIKVIFIWFEAAEHFGKNWPITVQNWIVEGARSSAVLKIPASYFDLRGLSRGIYLVARKHVRQQR